MKTSAFAKLIACPLLAAGLHAAGAIDKVQFSDGRLYIWQSGAAAVTTNEVLLPFQIVVNTNGTFTVKGGRERPLADGDILGSDGMLLRTDGSVTPVMDHVTSNRGRVIVMQDGEPLDVTGLVRIADGTALRADRKIMFPDGDSRWLLDGELFYTDGGALPAQDTITLQSGQVRVQKDGSVLSIGATRSITMNDGTKVLGDGTVIFFNGTRTKLEEGQTLVVEGVRRR